MCNLLSLALFTCTLLYISSPQPTSTLPILQPCHPPSFSRFEERTAHNPTLRSAPHLRKRTPNASRIVLAITPTLQKQSSKRGLRKHARHAGWWPVTMSEDPEVIPAAPLNGHPAGPHHHRSHSQHTASPPSSSQTTHDASVSFLRPSDLLRPKAPTPAIPPTRPPPDRQIDRDERAGLQACRDFLRARKCYDVLQLSFRLIELDVGLTVKESLQIMVQCGMCPVHMRKLG